MSSQFQLGEGGERERARERETEKEDVDDDGGCGVDDDKECDEESEMIVIMMIVIMMIMMIIIMMVMYNCPIEISHQGNSGRFSGEASCDRVALPNLQCVQGFSVFQKSSYGRAYAIFLHAYTYTHILGRHIVCTEFWFRENLPTVDAQSLARNGYPSMW